jgi:hypothetical protein
MTLNDAQEIYSKVGLFMKAKKSNNIVFAYYYVTSSNTYRAPGFDSQLKQVGKLWGLLMGAEGVKRLERQDGRAPTIVPRLSTRGDYLHVFYTLV